VITQIKLPPYRRPQSLLDLLASKIIFGHIFEAFRRMSHAKIDAAAVGDDNPLPKRARRAPILKKILTCKYVF
jgi:hypothetical protein